MANWKQAGPKVWELRNYRNSEHYAVVGKVIWCKDVDGATGWTAWVSGAPIPMPSNPAIKYRPLENVGDFRSLRDAMRHVMVLYKLEQ